MRASGILMHLSSLPSPYGIGTLGQAAYDFADFLALSGQKLWQILPVSPTSFGDSPYQSFSTYAGNPYFIDLDLLQKDGLLEEADYASLDWGTDPAAVDYALLYETRFPVLRKAYERFLEKLPQKLPTKKTASKGSTAEPVLPVASQADGDDTAASFVAFQAENKHWLGDYALYMALKTERKGEPWSMWPDGLKKREKTALKEAGTRLRKEIGFWNFLQYEFFTQWKKLKAYTGEKGIRLIGDAPIYVALDSADVWSHPELFLLDEDLQPVVVAGCPPDYFAKTGQLWGNPIYNWEVHKKTGYRWWVDRIASAVSIYDMVRIDHFRGFESFWAIPAGDDTAINGEWRKGPGMELFQKVRRRLSDAPIIAEDLGMITDPVRELLKESGYPGMKVLQFAFSLDSPSAYLPHNQVNNCICYTGTHDNDTLRGWIDSLNEEELAYVSSYARSSGKPDELVWDIIALAWSTVADTAIATAQDILGLDTKSRMNTPSTSQGNWSWRALPGVFTEDLAEKLSAITKTYWR